MIYGIVLVIHLLICATLVLVVLLQAGKGGGLAGAFGSMGAGGMGQSLFGGRGAATFLSKATTVLGIAFMATSLSLALLSGSTAPKSVLRQQAPGGAEVAPPPVSSEPVELPPAGELPGQPAGTGTQEGQTPAPTGTGTSETQTPPPPGGN